jgi:hypothetical protein
MAWANSNLPNAKEGLLTGGNDPMHAAGAATPASGKRELGCHHLLECHALTGSQSSSGESDRVQLATAALALADAPYEPAYSPIVLAGLVRMIEAALIIAVGSGVCVAYVVPGHSFSWYHFAAISKWRCCGLLGCMDLWLHWRLRFPVIARVSARFGLHFDRRKRE